MESIRFYDHVKSSLAKEARAVDLALIDFLMNKNYESVLKELVKFQNDDGGFGKALEPDSRMPYSSAVATEFAIKIIEDIINQDASALTACRLIIIDIIKYLWSTYQVDKGGWEIVPKEVDDFPHAVWWNYEGIKGFTPFNPTATFAGFLFKYDPENVMTDTLVQHITQLFMNTPNEEIEGHGLLCLIHLQEYLNEHENRARTKELFEKIQINRSPLTLEQFDQKINNAIIIKADWDPNNWNSYTMEPLKYIDSKEHPLYEAYQGIIHQNLDFLVNTINEKGFWDIHFTWCQYEDIFESTAKKEWPGYFAYENLKRLITFNYIEII